MTRDDIIRMAKEAGHPFLTASVVEQGAGPVPEWLERFAVLVAAEKDKEIKRLQDMLYEQLGELTALRAEKQMRTRIEQLKDPVDETTLDVSGATWFSATPAKWPVKEEPLGAEFSRVLHENLWDLYER